MSVFYYLAHFGLGYGTVLVQWLKRYGPVLGRQTQTNLGHTLAVDMGEIISLLSPLHSSPAGGTKTHMFVCQTALNLRGRRIVSPCSLLFCPDAGLIQTV